MSALGIWLWRTPTTFGNLKDASSCAIQSAELTILGCPVPCGSSALRNVSLVIYGFFLVCPYNLIISTITFIALFRALKLTGSTKHTMATPPPSPTSADPTQPPASAPGTVMVRRRSKTSPKRAIPAWIGLGILLAIDVILIADIELTLRRNQALQAGGDEAQWGFGQVLAVVLLVVPAWQCLTIRGRRRMNDKQQEYLDTLMRWAIEGKDVERIAYCVGLGADLDIIGKGEEPKSY